MLLLDVGNSRCKWALVQNGIWLRQGVAGNADWQALQHDFSTLPAPTRILISNVAGEDMAQRLRTLCSQWQVPLQFVQAQAEQCGVKNGYAEPDKLGSDRWAALIAAWHHTRSACLVVNCGTATTIDALSAQGEFLGGLIMPGISLMQQALTTNTAQLKPETGHVADFPCNTADAILTGILRSTSAAIQHQHGLLQLRAGKVTCLLGGGAADAVAPCLTMPVERVENMVLRGLQKIGESGT